MELGISSEYMQDTILTRLDSTKNMRVNAGPGNANSKGKVMKFPQTN
jgi:hypothetical protein